MCARVCLLLGAEIGTTSPTLIELHERLHTCQTTQFC